MRRSLLAAALKALALAGYAWASCESAFAAERAPGAAEQLLDGVAEQLLAEEMASQRPIARVARIATSEAPVIDRDLSDLCWAKATVIDDIRQRQPDPGAPATERTVLRIMYDDERHLLFPSTPMTANPTRSSSVRWRATANSHGRQHPDRPRSRPHANERLRVHDRCHPAAAGTDCGSTISKSSRVGHDVGRPRQARARRLGGGDRDSVPQHLLCARPDRLGLRFHPLHPAQGRDRSLVLDQSGDRADRRLRSRNADRHHATSPGPRPRHPALRRASRQA